MNRQGFTLVELLVAVTVSALLVTSVAGAIHSTLRTARGQESDSRVEERSARALELLRDDWRGRVRAVTDHEAVKSRPAGSTVLVLVTTADSLSGARLQREVVYEASEKGFKRSADGREIVLIESPVTLDFFDGATWRTDGSGFPRAIRLGGLRPSEVSVVR